MGITTPAGRNCKASSYAPTGGYRFPLLAGWQPLQRSASETTVQEIGGVAKFAEIQREELDSPGPFDQPGDIR